MNLQRTLLDLAFGIQVTVKAAARQPAAVHFYCGDFDNAVTQLGFQPGGLGVYKNLAHGLIPVEH